MPEKSWKKDFSDKYKIKYICFPFSPPIHSNILILPFFLFLPILPTHSLKHIYFSLLSFSSHSPRPIFASPLLSPLSRPKAYTSPPSSLSFRSSLSQRTNQTNQITKLLIHFFYGFMNCKFYLHFKNPTNNLTKLLIHLFNGFVNRK